MARSRAIHVTEGSSELVLEYRDQRDTARETAQAPTTLHRGYLDFAPPVNEILARPSLRILTAFCEGAGFCSLLAR
jgi:hypothetical protein